MLGCYVMCNAGVTWHRASAARSREACAVDVSELTINDIDDDNTESVSCVSPSASSFTAAFNTGLSLNVCLEPN